MKTKLNPEFRTTALIGWSDPFSTHKVAGYWNRLAEHAAWSLRPLEIDVQDSGTNFWRVSSLPSFTELADCKAPSTVNASAILDVQGIARADFDTWFAKARETGSFASGCIALDGCASPFGSARLRVHYSPDWLYPYKLVAGNVTSGVDESEFLSAILAATRLDGPFSARGAVDIPDCRLSVSPASDGDIVLGEIALRTPILYCISYSSLMIAVEFIVARLAPNMVGYNGLKFGHSFSEWGAASAQFQILHQGPWEVSHVLLAKRRWTSDMFSSQLVLPNEVPVGRLDFRRRGLHRPSSLRDVLIEVDLFRDGAFWHFGFHRQSTTMTRTTRDKLRLAINEQLGFNCISRAPEDIWPGM